MINLIVRLIYCGIFLTAFFFPKVAAQGAVNEIIFHSGSLPGVRSQIYSVRSDGTGQFNLSNDPDGWYSYPSWSPDGTKIVYSGAGIWVMNADGSDRLQIKRGAGSDYTPVWSPDGNSIAYVYDGHGFQAPSIYIVDLNGGSRWLADVGPYDSSTRRWDYGLTWSPDGSKIAFTRVENDSRLNIYSINADGTGEVALTQASPQGFYSNPSWSPDGSSIAFAAPTGPDNLRGTDIFVMNADGSNQRRITYLSTYALFPSWSPDGSQIVFSANSVFDPPFNIYLVNVDGTGLLQVTWNSFFDSVAPRWRPRPTLSISGRVVNSDGLPLRNVTVTVRDAAGNRRTALSSSLGFYRITGLAVGNSYILTAASKRFRFNPRTIVLSADVSDVTLIGQE